MRVEIRQNGVLLVAVTVRPTARRLTDVEAFMVRQISHKLQTAGRMKHGRYEARLCDGLATLDTEELST